MIIALASGYEIGGHWLQKEKLDTLQYEKRKN